MRRYAITCDFYRPKRCKALGDIIKKLSDEWEHPLTGLWLVKTSLTAGEIRTALLPHLDFQDRIYICEVGADNAEFNALPASGGKVTHIEEAREKSRMLAGIFSRNGQGSRHLKAATSKNLRSA